MQCDGGGKEHVSERMAVREAGQAAMKAGHVLFFLPIMVLAVCFLSAFFFMSFSSFSSFRDGSFQGIAPSGGLLFQESRRSFIKRDLRHVFLTELLFVLCFQKPRVDRFVCKVLFSVVDLLIHTGFRFFQRFLGTGELCFCAG